MKKIVLSLGVILLCGLPALAQEVPKVDLFLGYEYIRFAPELSGNPNVNLNGGGGSINFNINKMFGIKGEFAHAGSGDVRQCDSTGVNCLTRSVNFFTYLFGPQISFRSRRVTPYVHLLFGGAHSNLYGHLSTTSGTGTAEPNPNAFALAFGGGLDVNAGKHVAIRLGQFDYFMTRFSEHTVSSTGVVQEINNQSNFRYMAGINFLLGSKTK